MTTEEINKHDERELLLDSIRDFNEREYIPRQELFEGLKGEQKPHTLFIGCSDSRVVPHMLTNSLAGDLFVVRNIANLVPFYETETKKFVATSAVIEYAVLELKVENIVVADIQTVVVAELSIWGKSWINCIIRKNGSNLLSR